MKKTKLSKICGLSRQMIYNLINEGLSEEEILKRNFKAKEVIAYIEECELKSSDNETIYLEGIRKGFKQCKETYDKEFDKMKNDLKTIKSITKKVVINNWNTDTFDFTDVNDIYEIVKDY